ncbi:MAG: ATP-binding cassette domain-containing protein, partial [Delftia sp.]|nr:ATP-binding cassette domain-containing protein [Delftia sp.]
MSGPLLSVEGIHAHYGKSHVLQGVSLQVQDGELVTLLGRNGAGKTTTLKSIAGVMQPSQGQIRFGGEPVHRLATHQVAQRGICLVPEHRGIFKLLTVEENLLLGQRKRSPWQLADIYRI